MEWGKKPEACTSDSDRVTRCDMDRYARHTVSVKADTILAVEIFDNKSGLVLRDAKVFGRHKRIRNNKIVLVTAPDAHRKRVEAVCD